MTAPAGTVRRDGVLAAGTDEWRRAADWARRLAWWSLVYMLAEGAVGLAAGITAGSVALVGFGIDSGIEALAGLVVVWRLSGARAKSETAERRAQQVVAVSFALLAPFVAVEAIIKLADGTHPQPSLAGAVLAACSLVVMPLLGRAKQCLGVRLASEATAGEGNQNLLCAALAAAVLAGLVGNWAFGWWWLDPTVGLAVAAVAVVEARSAWRGDDCC